MLRDIEDRYFNDPTIDSVDKTLMVFASYNARGPIALRSYGTSRQRWLDANKWLDNVELMVAKDIGQVAVNYVSNAYKYYIAHKLALHQA